MVSSDYFPAIDVGRWVGLARYYTKLYNFTTLYKLNTHRQIPNSYPSVPQSSSSTRSITRIFLDLAASASSHSLGIAALTVCWNSGSGRASILVQTSSQPYTGHKQDTTAVAAAFLLLPLPFSFFLVASCISATHKSFSKLAASRWWEHLQRIAFVKYARL